MLEELFARVGEDGFGVELHAFDLVAAVTEAHDDAIVGFSGDGELAGQRFSFDDERVVAGRGERVGQLAVNILAVVMDFAGFAVEELWGANDFPSKRGANSLMAQANAENGKFPGESFDQLDRDTGFLRLARAGRKHDAFQLASAKFLDGAFIDSIAL